MESALERGLSLKHREACSFLTAMMKSILMTDGEMRTVGC